MITLDIIMTFARELMDAIEDISNFLSNDKNKIVLLCYDDDTNLYDEELSRTITINELTNIIEYLLKEN